MNLLTKMNSDANILGNISKTNFRFCLTCFVFLLKQIFHHNHFNIGSNLAKLIHTFATRISNFKVPR